MIDLLLDGEIIDRSLLNCLDPTVLSLWLKVAKPGGLLSFTHKTSVWPDWEEEQDRLEAAGLWQKVWVSIRLLIVTYYLGFVSRGLES